MPPIESRPRRQRNILYRIRGDKWLGNSLQLVKLDGLGLAL